MTTKHQLIEYREQNHGEPLEEWAPHRGVTGWWYVTGYLHGLADPEELFLYYFNQLHVHQIDTGQELLVLIMGFEDFRNKASIYEIDTCEISDNAYANQSEVVIKDAKLTLATDGLTIDARGKDVQYSLKLVPTKAPVWHGDNGVLVMGYPDRPKERTVYYSYTNLSTSGEVSYRRDSDLLVTLPVKGKSWFDRQWGPYENRNWDWFSLRFFDDEEIMLFSFPQQGYKSGTYVDKQGNARTFNDFSYMADRWIKVEGLRTTPMGLGWKVTVPMKEKNYTVLPFTDNQIKRHPTGCYWEGLAKIFNDREELVGYSVTGIVPVNEEKEWQ